MSRNARPKSNVRLSSFTGEPQTVKPQGQITLSILYGRVTNKIHETKTLDRHCTLDCSPVPGNNCLPQLGLVVRSPFSQTSDETFLSVYSWRCNEFFSKTHEFQCLESNERPWVCFRLFDVFVSAARDWPWRRGLSSRDGWARECVCVCVYAWNLGDCACWHQWEYSRLSYGRGDESLEASKIYRCGEEGVTRIRCRCTKGKKYPGSAMFLLPAAVKYTAGFPARYGNPRAFVCARNLGDRACWHQWEYSRN